MVTQDMVISNKLYGWGGVGWGGQQMQKKHAEKIFLAI